MDQNEKTSQILRHRTSKELGDILRELREDVRETCGPEDWEADRLTEYLRSLANRIEAAIRKMSIEIAVEAATSSSRRAIHDPRRTSRFQAP